MAKRKKSPAAPPPPRPQNVGFDASSDHEPVVAAIDMAQKLRQRGAIGEAAGLLDTARSIEPGNPAIGLLRAMLAEDTGALADAERLYRDVLANDPANQLARLRLAHCLTARHDYPAGLALLSGLLKENANLADVRRFAASTHMAMRHPARAVPHYEWLARANASLAAFHDLAAARDTAGDKDGAIAAYRETIRLGAPAAPVQVIMAQIELSRGDRAAALKLVRRALADEPDQPHGHYVLANYFAGDIDLPEALSAVEQALARTAGRALDPLRPREALHFATAIILDRLGRRDAAFAHYKAGNDLMSARFPGDEDRHQRRAAEARSLYPATTLAEPAPDSARASDQPVFILGMPRSATTLVEQVLAAHPEVAGVGEVDAFDWIADFIRLDLAPDRLETAARAYLDTYDRKTSRARRVIDKSISNFDYIGDILAVFPNARFIHCARHPLDTGLSCYQTMFQDNAVGFTTALDRFAARYRQYHDLVDHWRAALPGRILDVRYEDLVADLEGSARRLLAHLGLDWDERVLRYHEAVATVRTASLAQVRQPVFRSSLGKWRNYEAALAPLRDSLEDLVTQYELSATSPLTAG